MKPAVLIVDDEPGVRSLFRRVFEELGYVVSVVGCLSEAVEACRTPFHLVVVDYMLPDGDGLDLIRFVRRLPLPPTAVLTTGYAAASIEALALRCGGAAVIEKGFDTTALTVYAERFQQSFDLH